METKTEQVLRAILFTDIVTFVLERRGHKNKESLESEIDNIGKGDIVNYFHWSAIRKNKYIELDGELIACLGMRKIPFQMFKKFWLQIHGNGIEDEFLLNRFYDIEKNEVIKDKNFGEWTFIGVSKNPLPEWRDTECLAWTNTGNPDWDLDISESFVSVF